MQSVVTCESMYCSQPKQDGVFDLSLGMTAWMVVVNDPIVP